MTAVILSIAPLEDPIRSAGSSLVPGRPKKGYGIAPPRRMVWRETGSDPQERVSAEELACPSL